MRTPFRRGVLLAAIALPLSLGLRSDAIPRPSGRMKALPPMSLWAWERREDLGAVDAKQFAIAYLDQTLTIGATVHAQPRRDAIMFPPGAVRIGVVRIETAKGALLDGEARDETVAAILRTAQEPDLAALQIDFDATASQRGFYREVIEAVRRGMPVNLPLSITALASWCSFDDWLRGLPVDEAVPMMFRMEPDRRRAAASEQESVVREPLCGSSVGVSTTEPWPAQMEGKRVYVFSDRGWRNESLPGLQSRLERRLR